VLIACLALVLAGCGDSGEKEATSTPEAATTEAAPAPNESLPKGCENVAKPAPKDVGELKAPTEKLNKSKTYVAKVSTTCGDFEITLDAKRAPITGGSFKYLADQKFFDGLTFHRIVPDFVIQGGDPAGDGSGGPGYQFDNEVSKKVTFDDGGILAYANSGNDTNGSQFFITLGPQPDLDPTPSASYTIFGKVTKGMDVVQHIGALPTEADAPTQPVYIDSITVDERA
jgi:peptidyl-prolyl cis-trans isomerase B (cyclophilin B)